MTKFMRVLVGCAISLMALAPSLAFAASNTGVVTRVRSCYDGASTRKIVIQLDGNKWFYIGIEGSNTGGSLTSIATAAMLSGRTVRVVNGTSAVTMCGAENLLAFPAFGADYYIELQ